MEFELQKLSRQNFLEKAEIIWKYVSKFTHFSFSPYVS
jgi:hypothetical protein